MNLTEIAKKHLRIETLETRRSDRLDFHEVAVWNVKEALKAAYEAGLQAATQKTTEDGMAFPRRRDSLEQRRAWQRQSQLAEKAHAEQLPGSP